MHRSVTHHNQKGFLQDARLLQYLIIKEWNLPYYWVEEGKPCDHADGCTRSFYKI
jgi:hypothetical protein